MCPSSEAPASARSFARSAVPARKVAFPEMNVCLDAELFPASGVVSVSAPSVTMHDMSTPTASAQICVITVLAPCPMSTAP